MAHSQPRSQPPSSVPSRAQSQPKSQRPSPAPSRAPSQPRSQPHSPTLSEAPSRAEAHPEPTLPEIRAELQAQSQSRTQEKRNGAGDPGRQLLQPHLMCAAMPPIWTYNACWWVGGLPPPPHLCSTALWDPLAPYYNYYAPTGFNYRQQPVPAFPPVSTVVLGVARPRSAFCCEHCQQCHHHDELRRQVGRKPGAYEESRAHGERAAAHRACPYCRRQFMQPLMLSSSQKDNKTYVRDSGYNVRKNDNPDPKTQKETKYTFHSEAVLGDIFSDFGGSDDEDYDVAHIPRPIKNLKNKVTRNERSKLVVRDGKVVWMSTVTDDDKADP